MGFDWPDALGPIAKVREEIEEVMEHIAPDGRVIDQDALEGELGDLLFAVVNLCRKTGVHAGLALDRANLKFTSRYGAMETIANARGLELATMSLAEQDQIWDEVKARQSLSEPT